MSNEVKTVTSPTPPMANIGKAPLTGEVPSTMSVDQAFEQERRERRKAYLREYSQQWRQKHPSYWRTPAMRDRQSKWRAARKRKQTLWREAQQACAAAMTALAVSDIIGYFRAMARLLDVVQVFEDEFRDVVREGGAGAAVARPVAITEDEAAEWKAQLDDRIRDTEGKDRVAEFRDIVRMYWQQRSRQDKRADWTREWLEIAFADMQERGLYSEKANLHEEMSYIREAMER